MSEPERISAIITCYNGAAFVSDAIASIRRQKVPVAEIVVIDDGSTDETAAVVASLSGDDLVYHYQANQGLPCARNAGLEKSSGTIITFLDYDDLWTDTKLEIQVAMLQAVPQPDLVVGWAQTMRMVKLPDGTLTFEPHDKPAPALSMNGAAIRREVFERVGLFDPTQKYCDDWDWYMRVRELGLRIKLHDDVVHYYRRHDKNMTNNVEVGNQHTLLMLKKSLERRRKLHGTAQSLPNLLNGDD
jgi:glycosyltransferase involved in cell wall biosynthesis